MRKYRIQFPPPARSRALTRERVEDIAVICLRYGNGVSHGFLGPVEPIIKKYGVSLFEIAEPDCLFICLSQVTHKDWERTSKIFYEQAVNAMQDVLSGAGYASGRERLYPDESGREAHAFPDGDICRLAYRRSFGKSFSEI
jgi:hypothetical protein